MRPPDIGYASFPRGPGAPHSSKGWSGGAAESLIRATNIGFRAGAHTPRDYGACVVPAESNLRETLLVIELLDEEGAERIGIRSAPFAAFRDSADGVRAFACMRGSPHTLDGEECGNLS